MRDADEPQDPRGDLLARPRLALRVHVLGGTKAAGLGRTAAGLPSRGRFEDPHRYPRTRARFRYRSAGLATSSHLGMTTIGNSK